MRESPDRQVGQVEEGGPGSVLKVEDDEEVYAEQSARGQFDDKGIGSGGDVQEVIVGEILRRRSNISNNDLEHNQQPECFPVMSKSDSNLIYIKPAPVTNNKDI